MSQCPRIFPARFSQSLPGKMSDGGPEAIIYFRCIHFQLVFQTLHFLL